MAEQHSDSNLPSLDVIEASLDVTYTWGYQDTRKELRDLYRKAQRNQWVSEDVLPWDTDVDMEAPKAPPEFHPLFGSDIYRNLSKKEITNIDIETSAWSLSQFLHGEQGALLAAAQLVNSVPDLDSKLYGGTQVVDEARHVDVYNRYLHEKVGFSYPVNSHLKTLLDMILTDSRWDMKFLGMQIMVEGLALAAFAMVRQTTYEPLLKELTAYVMGDEARHVAYGVISLRDHYENFNEKDRQEREDFVYEAAVLMRDRFLFQEVWEKIGLPAEKCMAITLDNKGQQMFRQMLFSRIVPCVKRIGLLSDKQRERFQELGILHFEDAIDPDTELAKEEAYRAGAAA